MAFPTAAELQDALTPLLAEFGLVIEDLAVAKAGAKSSVRIAVDSAQPRQARPDMDAIEEVSKAISAHFDAAEEQGTLNFGPGYTLEIGTPGVDFPLTEQRHWEKHIGRQVRTKSGELVRILQVEGKELMLLAYAKQGKQQPKGVAGTFKITQRQIEELAPAVVEIEFNAAPQQELQLVDLPWDAYDPVAATDA